MFVNPRSSFWWPFRITRSGLRKLASGAKIMQDQHAASLAWEAIVTEYLWPAWVFVAQATYFRLPPKIRSRLQRLISMCLSVASRIKKKVIRTLGGSEQPFSSGNHMAGVARGPAVDSIEASSINIVTWTFLDRKGEEYLYGGAERYHLELARIAKDLGYDTVIYQASNTTWERTYHGIRVRGLGNYPNPQELSREFHRAVNPAALTVYSPFVMAFPSSFPRSVGISHGIFWDNLERQSPRVKYHYWLRSVSHAIAQCSHVVSVDTNTINWVRSTISDQAEKFEYIPNFVDLDEFGPGNNCPRSGDKIVVLYPRRLYSPRGFWLMKDLVPCFLQTYPHVEFHFVGQANDVEQEAVESMVAQYGQRVQWYYLEPEDMHKAYHRADIVLIPTVHSEGTSLSCLEAMACGNAVIATNVGGLPDLVIDGFNGLLVRPYIDDLREALVTLIEDSQLRDRLGSNALQVSKSFSKKQWEMRWRDLLESRLPIKNAPSAGVENNAVTFIHLAADGRTWDRMKQRPQHLFRAFAAAGHRAYFISWKQTAFECEPWPGLTIHGRHACVDVESPVLYISDAFSYEKAKAYRSPIVLFDILDHPSIHEAPRYLQQFEKLLREAHIVTTSSSVLYEEFKDTRPDMILAPNGVWPEDFNHSSHGARPEDLPESNKPEIGFVGALGNWVDFELLQYAAQSCPGYAFVLIGPTAAHSAVAELTKSCKNVHYLGEKKYEELPRYLSWLDVGMVPFVINQVTNTACVLELFEYAAAGKPIVVTANEEMAGSGVALVGKDFPDFADKLGQALELKNDADYQKALQTLAKEASWSARVAPIVSAVEKLRRS